MKPYVHARSLVFAVALLLATAVRAAPLPEAEPDQVGMSAERLQRITTTFKKAIEAGDMPGVVIMIARGGKLVYQEALGMQDQATKTPMAMDSIFRIYSMTKPIVSVAAMT